MVGLCGFEEEGISMGVGSGVLVLEFAGKEVRMRGRCVLCYDTQSVTFFSFREKKSRHQKTNSK